MITHKDDERVYIHFIRVHYNDLTATSPGLVVSRGDYPKWPKFRSVNYYNLPTYICI